MLTVTQAQSVVWQIYRVRAHNTHDRDFIPKSPAPFPLITQCHDDCDKSVSKSRSSNLDFLGLKIAEKHSIVR